MAYNLIRLFVGSLAYLAILATFFYLYAFKWLDKHEGVISGFLSFFAGVLLMFQAFFVSSLHLDNNGIKVTFSRIMADLIHLRVESFAGGGMIGALLYAPDFLPLFKYWLLFYWPSLYWIGDSLDESLLHL